MLDLWNLETVHHEIDHTFFRAGEIAPGTDLGDAPAEFLGEGLADLVFQGGDNHHRLGLVQALHNKVDGFVAHKVGDDGI